MCAGVVVVVCVCVCVCVWFDLKILINLFFLLHQVQGTAELSRLHFKVRNLLLKFTRQVPPECSFLSSQDTESVIEEKTPLWEKPEGKVEETAKGKESVIEEPEGKGTVEKKPEETVGDPEGMKPVVKEPEGKDAVEKKLEEIVEEPEGKEEESSRAELINNDSKRVKEDHRERLKKDDKETLKEKVAPFHEHLPVNRPSEVSKLHNTVSFYA